MRTFPVVLTTCFAILLHSGLDRLQVHVSVEYMVFDGHLAFEQEGAFAVSGGVKFHFVRHRWCEPCAAHDTYLTALQFKLWDVLV